MKMVTVLFVWNFMVATSLLEIPQSRALVKNTDLNNNHMHNIRTRTSRPPKKALKYQNLMKKLKNVYIYIYIYAGIVCSIFLF